MATGPAGLDARNLVSRVKLLLNKQLVSILKEERLPHSGVKAAMQARIITHVEEYARKGDTDRFNRLRDLIYNPDTAQSPGVSKFSHSSPTSPLFPTTPSRHTNGSSRAHGDPPPMPPSSFSGLPARPHFKESPFYTIIEPLTPSEDCPVMNCHRHTVTLPLRFQKPIIDKLKADSSLRVMVYCASDTGLGPYAKADITFPHQVELKVNNDEIKANLRGLKNKPGSTRPADITNHVHKTEKYQNTVTMTYALTHKKFSVVINLVKQHSVDELVRKLRLGRLISKEKVINEMVTRAQDADIVATSTVMSLKCPLSTLRMDLPCRSTLCLHNQCFDAASFLQLQEQGPTWTCPICNKIISFEVLVVDQYVDDILRKTSRSVDQVSIEPDGRWSHNTRPSSQSRDARDSSSNNLDDEDIVEIQDARVASLKKEATPVMSSIARTPPSSSREPSSSTASRHQSTSNKRPAAKVIDLTLSDSDDDSEPPRPAKRQMTGHCNDVTSTLQNRNGIKQSGGDGRSQGVNFNLPQANPRTPEPPEFNYLAFGSGS
ncbi:MAG: SUMO ligase siz1 [Sclerophora amabilis]|nr:MAG: SUMO ligase siz1 [Sclerophora amabilis]